MYTMQNLYQKLLEVEQLAKSSKTKRLFARPLYYIYGMFFSKCIYPIRKKGVWANAETFFDKPMKVLLPSGLDIFLVKGKSHDFEIRLAKFILNYLSEGDTFIDVGANFGYFSLLASQIIGEQGSVFAYEASANTFSVLQKNTKNEKNIQLFHRAIADKDNQKVHFFEFPILFSEYNTLDTKLFEKEKWFQKNPAKAIEVESITLDTLIFLQKITPKIIKIDVEGKEEMAISGASKLLATQSPYIVLEYLSKERYNENHQNATKLLEKVGFLPHFINDEGILENCKDVEFFLNSRNLYSDNVVFVKKN